VPCKRDQLSEIIALVYREQIDLGSIINM